MGYEVEGTGDTHGLLHVGDEVVLVLLLLETSERHLSARDVLCFIGRIVGVVSDLSNREETERRTGTHSVGENTANSARFHVSAALRSPTLKETHLGVL